MSDRYTFSTAIPEFNMPKFMARLLTLALPVDGVADERAEFGRIGVDFTTTPTQQQLDLVAAEIVTHDPTDYIAAQNLEAVTTQTDYTDGLEALNMRSVFYCAIIRQLADKYGETPTITTRTEATTWLNANTDFASFAAGQRQFLRRLIDAVAEAAQIAMRG